MISKKKLNHDIILIKIIKPRIIKNKDNIMENLKCQQQEKYY